MAAEAELLKKKQIIKCEAQKLKIREELTKAKARVSANDKAKPTNSEEAIIHKENCFNTWDSIAVRGHCKEELRQKQSIKKNVPAVAVDEGVSKMMCQLLKQQSASDIHIDVFSGNPMDFHYFMAVFNELVEKKVDDPRGN